MTMTAIVSIGLSDVATQPSSIRIADRGLDDSNSNDGRGATIDGAVVHGGHQLPPIDGGVAAWKVLFGAFVFEALLWGKV